MRAIEQREGLLAEGVRTYAEKSVDWLRWNLGLVTVVLGILGAAVLTRELILRRRREALGLFIAFCTGGLLYLVRPSIYADQPWAMRRFLPVLIPAFLVFAAITISVVFEWLAQRTPRLAARLVATVMIVGVVAIPAIGTMKVRDMSSQANFLEPIKWTCDQVGPDAAILVVPTTTSYLHRQIPQTLRSWCDIPAALAIEAQTHDGVEQLAARAENQGRSLYLLASNQEALEALGVKAARTSPQAFNGTSLRPSLRMLPDSYKAEHYTVSIGQVRGP
jgi:hypothetical protein